MKKKLVIVLVLAAAVAGLLYLLYLEGVILAGFDSITPRQAYEMIESDPDIVILDVRTPEEYAAGHLDGALLIPVRQVRERLGELTPVKSRSLVVYCAVGGRSAIATRILVDSGFRAYNLDGGIEAWEREGLPVQRR